MEERWHVGDVILWFETADMVGAKTDSDIFLNFYDEKDQLICWAEAYERSDMGAFEEGDINCGYLGNLEKQRWLKTLLDRGVKLGIRARQVSDDSPDWYVVGITLDFRLGPLATTPTTRHWEIEDWIKPGLAESRFTCNAFTNPGFDKELEMQSGSPDDEPHREE